VTRILGVLNFKGGTGKTTTVVNLADGLARAGRRVLMIDLDAQGNLATYLSVPYRYTITNLMLGQVGIEPCIVNARPRLDLIASDHSLLEAEGQLWRMDDYQAARQSVSEKLGNLVGYDYIVVDYSPSVSLLSESGLIYTGELIVPVATDHLAVVGFRHVSKTLREIGRIPEHGVRLRAIVPTFYDGRLRKDRSILKTLQRYFPDQIGAPVRRNVKLAEAPAKNKTIFEYAPRSHGAEDYQKLVDQILSSEYPPPH
jgi:chromosome partitioning protein